MLIAELKPSQRVKNRWLVKLDEGTILRVDEREMVEFALHVGMEVSVQQAEKIERHAQQSQRKKKALDLLSRKPLSVGELSAKIQEWGGSEDECEEICLRLQELGYLDDAEYAQRIVQHYSKKGYGARKLRDELYRRKVPRALWDDALETAPSPEGAIERFVEKKLAGKTPDRATLQKVGQALARRGFSWSEIREVLDGYLE